MCQANTSTLSGLASFGKLQILLAARRHEGSAEAEMAFEASPSASSDRWSRGPGTRKPLTRYPNPF
jgi:hypothetical protein